MVTLYLIGVLTKPAGAFSAGPPTTLQSIQIAQVEPWPRTDKDEVWVVLSPGIEEEDFDSCAARAKKWAEDKYPGLRHLFSWRQ
jgi:hypothetical protein